MSKDFIEREIRDLLDDEFIHKAIDHAESKYTNKLQIQPFMFGCAFAIGFYKKEMAGYDQAIQERDEARAEVERLTDLLHESYNDIERMEITQDALKAQLGIAKEAANKLLFALQCMIINKNGPCPGLTDQQVFDGACETRDFAKDALTQLEQTKEE